VVLVSAELIQDSAYNLEQVLGNLIGIRLGRGTNAALTTGDGNGDPNGIVVASTAGVTAASATAFTADELYDLVHSVDPAYRGMPGCAFMMHDSVIKAIRKLKNGDGQYLWQPGLGVGSPDRLLGYPVEVNQQMAGTIEASAKIALFGDFSKYMVREVAGLRFRKLEERYADTDQVAYIAFLRMDGDLIDAGTHPVKHLIMHA
jgi:HK97 family phage major capsid protein